MRGLVVLLLVGCVWAVEDVAPVEILGLAERVERMALRAKDRSERYIARGKRWLDEQEAIQNRFLFDELHQVALRENRFFEVERSEEERLEYLALESARTKKARDSVQAGLNRAEADVIANVQKAIRDLERGLNEATTDLYSGLSHASADSTPEDARADLLRKTRSAALDLLRGVKRSRRDYRKGIYAARNDLRAGDLRAHQDLEL